MTLLAELERLGRAVAATGAVGDVTVKLPRVAFFKAVQEADARTTVAHYDGKSLAIATHWGTVRATISEDE